MGENDSSLAQNFMNRVSILSLTYEEFVRHFSKVTGRGETFSRPLYRQVFQEGLFAPEQLPVFQGRDDMLAQIKETFDLELLCLEQKAKEGAQKLVFRTIDGHPIESVIIPMKEYHTLCISSQVGCAMGCNFCETARMGLYRNLTAAEIVAQFFYVRHHLHQELRNVVFMGMGEPLDNLDAVLQAARVLTGDHGFNLRQAHVTVSTSGRVDGIRRLAAEEATHMQLALSLNAGNDALRSQLMPINRRYPLSVLKKALQDYPLRSREVFFVEYVLIQGVNDSLKDAREVADFCRGLPVRINLIPYNPGRLEHLRPSDPDVMEAFYQELLHQGYHVTRRTPRGEQILAACGQLATSFRRQHQPLLVSS